MPSILKLEEGAKRKHVFESTKLGSSKKQHWSACADLLTPSRHSGSVIGRLFGSHLVHLIGDGEVENVVIWVGDVQLQTIGQLLSEMS